MLEGAFDLVLASFLVALGRSALQFEDLFRAVVLYIAYGLLMALAWSRLSAPDVALAEAAIGAGVTGALFLDAARDLKRAAKERKPRVGWRFAISLLGAVVAAGISLALIGILPESAESEGLTARVGQSLSEAGVSQPVTAVIMNFRSFDTWLELLVLLVAMSSSLVFHRTFRLHTLRSSWPHSSGPEPVLAALANVLTPCALAAGAYLVFRGSSGPGGAFQGGALLGAAGVLSLLRGRGELFRLRQRFFLSTAVAGVVAFLVFSLGTGLVGRAVLEYPPGLAGTLLLALEVASAVSIGVTLSVLFAAARPSG